MTDQPRDPNLQVPDSLAYVDPVTQRLTPLIRFSGPPEGPEPQPSTLGRIAGEFGRGLARGTYQTGALLANAAQLEGLESTLDKAAAAYHRDVERMGDIENVPDAFVWASGAIAENAPTIAVVIGGALAGGWLASGAAALRGLQMAGTAVRTGQWAGAIAADLALQTGETKKQLEAAGIDPTFYNTAPAAVMKATLDVLPIMAVARRIGLSPQAISKAVTQAALSSGILRTTGTVGGLMLGEATTEGLQQFIDQATINIINEGTLRFPNAEEWSEIAESFVTGGVAMSPFAITGALRTPRGAADERPEETGRAVIEPEAPAIPPAASPKVPGGPIGPRPDAGQPPAPPPAELSSGAPPAPQPQPRPQPPTSVTEAPPPFSLPVWHGSPHDFDKFSLTKVGTGEGVQAFGHGLYFAGQKGVAKFYRDSLTKRSDLPGYLYEVELKLDPDDLLDWDKPLSEQSPKVREALDKLGLLKDPWELGEVRKLGAGKYEVLSSKGETIGFINYLMGDYEIQGAQGRSYKTPQEAAEALVRATGEAIYRKLTQTLVGSKVAASDTLRKAGIIGIRYKDAQARGTDRESYNYVVFDDSLIDLKSKQQGKKSGSATVELIPQPTVATTQPTTRAPSLAETDQEGRVKKPSDSIEEGIGSDVTGYIKGKPATQADYIADQIIREKSTLRRELDILEFAPREVDIQTKLDEAGKAIKPPFIYVPESNLTDRTSFIKGFISETEAQAFANATGERVVRMDTSKAEPAYVADGRLYYYDREVAKGQAPKLLPPDVKAKLEELYGQPAEPLLPVPDWVKKNFDEKELLRYTKRLERALDPTNDLPSKLFENFPKNTLKVRTPATKSTIEPARIEALLREWQKKYLPNSRIVLGYLKGEKLGQSAHFSPGADYIINVNPNLPPQAIYTVLAHEMGHLIEMHYYHTAPKSIRNAVYNDYLRHLSAVRGVSADEFWKRYGAAGDRGARYVEGNTQPFPGTYALKTEQYLLSFREWFAQQVARHLEQEAVESPSARYQAESFWKGLVEKLRDFYNSLAAPFRKNESFEKFMAYVNRASAIDRAYDEVKPYVPDAKDYGTSIATDASDPPNHMAGADLRRMFNNAEVPITPHVDTALAKFGKLHEWGYTLLQIAKRYPHVRGLQTYKDLVQKQWADKSKIEALANDTIQRWHKNLNRDQAERLSKFLFDVTLDSSRKGRRLTAEELAAWTTKHGVNADGMAMYERIEADFKNILLQLRENLLDDAWRTAAGDAEIYGALKNGIEADMAKLLNRNYFPLARFGQYGVRMKAKKSLKWEGDTFRPGQLMSFETFETEAEGKKRYEELLKAMPEGAVELTTPYLDDKVFTFMGFPPSLVESRAAALHLTEDQKQHLRELMAEMTPSQSFKRNLVRRKGIRGFSQDALRSYASYMQHAAGHISRGRYYVPITEAIQDVRGNKASMGSYDRGKLESYMWEHYHYTNNPGNEWAGVRGFFFMWYLGFSVKSAAVNLTQVPMIAQPWLAARFGDFRSAAALAGAMRDTGLSFRKGKGITEAEAQMLELGRQEGWLDESLATELAGVAEGQGIARLVPGSRTEQLMRNLAYASSYMFHKAELFNRRATALAAFRLSGGNVALAKEAVQTTMFEYARWNRPKLMRGKRSVLFLFKQYLQHMLYFAGAEKGRGRAMLMLAAMAGLQGLPGMEDLLDALDAIKGLVGRWTGLVNPRSDLRTDIRELLVELGANPNLVMSGLGKYGMGTGAEFDVSGSLSVGRVIPGVEAIGRALSLGTVDVNELTRQITEEVGGAVPSVGFRMIQAVASRDPDQIKRLELAMPSAARDISRALRYWNTGIETNTLGDVLVEFDATDTEHQAQIVMQALGFRPTRVALRQEQVRAQRDATEYYATRRELLRAQYFHARKSRDREFLADVNEAIRTYNSEVPFSGLKITSKDKQESYERRLREQKKREAGLPTSRRDRQLYQAIEGAYPAS